MPRCCGTRSMPQVSGDPYARVSRPPLRGGRVRQIRPVRLATRILRRPGADDRPRRRSLADARERSRPRRCDCPRCCRRGARCAKEARLYARAIHALTHFDRAAFGGALIRAGEGMVDGVRDMGKGLWALTGRGDRSGNSRDRGRARRLPLTPRNGLSSHSRCELGEWSKDPARAFATPQSTWRACSSRQWHSAKAGDAARIATEVPAIAELSPEMLAVTKATEANPAKLDGFPPGETNRQGKLGTAEIRSNVFQEGQL